MSCITTIVIITLALFAPLSTAAPVKLCVTHTQDLRPAATAALEARGFEIDPMPVVQVDFGRDPNLTRSSPEVRRGFEAFARPSERTNFIVNYEYDDHYANNSLNTHAQLSLKQTLAGEIRRLGHRAGIYGPARIRANAQTAISETSIENLKAVGRLFDFVVIPVYIGVHFEPGSPVERRYMLNTLAALREIRAVLPDHVEIMLAFQLSVRPSGNTRSAMTEHEALVMGQVIAASGATPLWWFEAREGSANAIDRRIVEVDALGGKFRTGLSRHRVYRNMDIGDPQGAGE